MDKTQKTEEDAMNPTTNLLKDYLILHKDDILTGMADIKRKTYRAAEEYKAQAKPLKMHVQLKLGDFDPRFRNLPDAYFVVAEYVPGDGTDAESIFLENTLVFGYDTLFWEHFGFSSHDPHANNKVNAMRTLAEVRDYAIDADKLTPDEFDGWVEALANIEWDRLAKQYVSGGWRDKDYADALRRADEFVFDTVSARKYVGNLWAEEDFNSWLVIRVPMGTTPENFDEAVLSSVDDEDIILQDMDDEDKDAELAPDLAMWKIYSHEQYIRAYNDGKDDELPDEIYPCLVVAVADKIC